MLFNASAFPLFFLVTLSVFYLLAVPKRKIFLVLASYFFYAGWDWRFCSLLLFSTFVDFYCGKKMESAALEKRKSYLWLSLAANLGLLGAFKYYNFFADSFMVLLGAMGLSPSLPVLNVILPVGISFYTFQTLSYTIDVYRGELKATRDFFAFALYVSFFPQLVAGPIEKATHLLPQLNRLGNATRTQWKEGWSLMLLGYFKKVVIGDQIGQFVDPTFASWQTLPSMVLVEGLCLFSLQIYFDFSGYSDIARGVSKWFGIDLMVNFKQPYLSRNITEFWRRWHISLSQWLREYLYIPLGGNRLGKPRTYFNLLATMFLGGLWHGASWNFVLWGTLHGIYLAVHKAFLGGKKITDERPQLGISQVPGFLLSLILTQVLVLLTWLPFRSPNIHETWGYLKRMLSLQGDTNPTPLLFAGCFYVLLLIVDLPTYLKGKESYEWNRPAFQRYLYWILFVLVIGFFSLSQKEPRPFIYFQF